MSQVKQYPTEILQIDEIRPYWRNPRRVTEDAVNAVAASITEFGYNQPIVVDEEHVIIVGHTRYAALRRLEVEDVPVKIAVGLSPSKVKQLRIIDNRTAELTRWDFDQLAQEIEDLDSDLMRALFPDVDVAVGSEGPAVELEVEGRSWDEVVPGVDFVCVHCFHSFSLPVTREDILSGKPLKAAGERVAS